MNSFFSSKYGKYFAVFFLLLFLIFSDKMPAQTPVSINVNTNVIYSFPLPGSKYITPGSDIILRASGKINPATVNNSLFTVSGSKSGMHIGKIILSDNGETVLFKPAVYFSYGEKVIVKMNTGLQTFSGEDVVLQPFSFSTSISNDNVNARADIFNGISSQPDQALINSSVKQLSKNSAAQKLPANFPTLIVDASSNPTNGYLFLASYVISSSAYGGYIIVADKNGNPLFYRKTEGPATDFKVQPTGVLTYFDEGPEQFYVMNTSLKLSTV